MNKEILLRLVNKMESTILENGELPFLERQMLRLSMQEEFGDEVVWCLLEISSARKVWPIWRRNFPNEKAPLELLIEAETQLLKGSTKSIDIVEIGRIKTQIENKFLLGETVFNSVYAGFSCLAAARNVFFGVPSIQEVSSELDLDVDEWDASFIASLAFAGGAVWEENPGNPKLRREFWKWFLEKAAELVTEPRIII